MRRLPSGSLSCSCVPYCCGRLGSRRRSDMMSVKLGTTLAALSVAMLLTGCGGGRKGAFDRSRPNEFAVQRNAPLVVPPDFALVPPRPGTPRPQEIDSQGQAMQALFGGRAPDTPVGTTVLNQA